MAYTSMFENIIFVEGSCEFLNFMGNLEYKKDSFFNQQFRNLDDVKHQLAEKAKKLGANAIINFRYGQKTISFFKAMLLAADDNVNWYASGEAVVLTEEKFNELLTKCEKK